MEADTKGSSSTLEVQGWGVISRGGNYDLNPKKIKKKKKKT